MTSLQIKTEARGQTLFMTLTGEFDLSGLVDFQRALADVRGRDVTKICVDLRGLTFIGATGLRELLKIQARADRDGFELFVVKGPKLVQKVLEMTGVDRRLVLIEDPASLAS